MASYVVTSWTAANEAAPETGQFVAIHARSAGVVSWLLTQLQINPALTLTLSAEELALSRGSLSGDVAAIVPLENICSTRHGRQKPLTGALALLVVSLAAAPSLAALSPLATYLVALLGVIAAATYYLTGTRLVLAFTEHSGRTLTVPLQPGRGGPVAVDDAQAAYVAQLVQALIEERKSHLNGSLVTAEVSS